MRRIAATAGRMMACTLSGRNLKQVVIEGYVVIYILSAVNLAIFPKLSVTVHEKRKESAKK